MFCTYMDLYMYYHIYFHDQSVLPNTKIIPACCLNFLYSQALTLFLCWDSETCSEEEDSVVSSLFRAIDGKKGKEGKEKKGKKEKAGKKGRKSRKRRRSSSSSSSGTSDSDSSSGSESESSSSSKARV